MIRSGLAMVALAGALISASPMSAASHRHAAPPAAVQSCGEGVHRLQAAYVSSAPTCCRDSLGCAEFLSTTTIVHPKAPIRS